MNLAFNDVETATKLSLSIDNVSTVRIWLCLKAPHLPLESHLDQASLIQMNGHLVIFTCPRCNKLVLDNPRVRLPKHIWHMCSVCGSKFPAEPLYMSSLWLGWMYTSLIRVYPSLFHLLLLGNLRWR